MFCQCMNKDSNFLPLGVLSGFYRVASVNSVQVTPVQFSTFCSSRLHFRQVFGNLSKNLKICPYHFDVLIISNRPLATVPSAIES